MKKLTKIKLKENRKENHETKRNTKINRNADYNTRNRNIKKLFFIMRIITKYQNKKIYVVTNINYKFIFNK